MSRSDPPAQPAGSPTGGSDRRERWTALLAGLEERLERVRHMGPPEARRRHVERGRRLVRDRVGRLLDAGTVLMELSPLAASGFYEDQVPGAGVVTGVGRIHGSPVMIMANDPTVKGGSYYPLGVRKQLRAQEIAMDLELPCLYLVDSGGAFLPLQSQIFPDVSHGGRLFCHQAWMSAAGVGQVAVVLGPCTAGGAYAPAMCDQVVMVRDAGAIFLGGPPLVKAATGEDVTVEELGGADVHTRISGVADYLAEDEDQALDLARDLLGSAGSPRPGRRRPQRPARDPSRNPVDLLDLLPVEGEGLPDPHGVIDCLADRDSWRERGAGIDPGLVTGFTRIGGHEVAVLVVTGSIAGPGLGPASAFLESVATRSVPLVLLVDLAAPVGARRSLDARVLRAFLRTLLVGVRHRLTVITGHGSLPDSVLGGVCCGGSGYRWLLPSTRFVSWIDPEGEGGFELEGGSLGALESTGRVWDDGILDPRDLRATLIEALGTLPAPAA